MLGLGLGGDVILLGMGALLAVLWGFTFRDFNRQLDRRWTYVAGVRRGPAEWWGTLRTPLAEPALERQRMRLTRYLVVVVAQFTFGFTAMAVDLRLFG